MTSHLISYASDTFKLSLNVLMTTAKSCGIDNVRPFYKSDLYKTDFYQLHFEVLNATRGGGYWLWKPYFVNKVLNDIDVGDVLIYSDAGIFILDSLQPLFDICRQNAGIMLFQAHYDNFGRPGRCVNSRWTKRDAFILMECDDERYHNDLHVDGSFQIYIKNKFSLQFVHDYLTYCTDKRILTDIPNECGSKNLPDFIDHRHDQSVLSLLASKYHLEIFRHPSQYGNYCKSPQLRIFKEHVHQPYSKQPYDNSPYPMLIYHHRTRT